MEKQIILSLDLIDVLSKMKHPFAEIMLKAHYNKETVVENSYIDVANEGMVSYLPASKEVDRNGDNITDKWNAKGRQKVSIGRMIRAILKNKNITVSDKDIEIFGSEYKSLRDTHDFKIITGNNIPKYYLLDSYDLSYYNREGKNPGRSLYGSCMRHDNCQNFFTLYKNNPNIKLLGLFNDKGLLTGRSLIWDNVIYGSKTITLMDRIYTIEASLEEAFKNYAIQQGWWYKVRQGTDQNTHVPFRAISNGKDVDNNPILISYLPDNIDFAKYQKPYIDTFRFYGYISKDDKISPVLVNHPNDNDRSPSTYNWMERWDKIDGGIYQNSKYSHRMDIFKTPIMPLPFIKFEDGLYLTNIDTYQDIYSNNDSYFSSKSQTTIILFSPEKEPLLFISLDYHKNKDTFQRIEHIRMYNRKMKVPTKLHPYIVDFLIDRRLQINPFINSDNNLVFKISDIKDEKLNDKFKNKIGVLTTNMPSDLNTYQLKLALENDLEYAKKLNINDIFNIIKSKILSDDYLSSVCKTFSNNDVVYDDGKLWVIFDKSIINKIGEIDEAKGKITTFDKHVLDIREVSNTKYKMELCHSWNYNKKWGRIRDLSQIKKYSTQVKVPDGHKYLSQSGGTIGTFIELGSNQCRITWQNGHTNTYNYSDLLIESYTSIIEMVVDSISIVAKPLSWIPVDIKLKVGDTVKIKDESPYYKQAPDLEGRIISISNLDYDKDDESTHYIYIVEFPNRVTNSYRAIDLLHNKIR